LDSEFTYTPERLPRQTKRGGKTGDRLPSGLMDFDISDKSAIEHSWQILDP
jgi:hypothetical protein